MLSMSPNTGQAQGFYLDPSGMSLPGPAPLPPPTTASRPSSSSEDPSKKARKPYTITKSRESWTEPEHEKFLEALQLFDRDWKKIEGFVGSKTVIQIRSHAQKYFLKVQKNGSSQRVPPPRPKRKSAHPYPQKATKIASQCAGTYEPASTIYKPGHEYCSEASLAITNQPTSAPLPTWNYSSNPTPGLVNEGDEELAACVTLPSGCCSSSIESAPNEWPSDYRSDVNLNKVMPDFGQVYSFLGSIFDPKARNHLQRLRLMDPVNVKTALLLMKNLSVNLKSPEFQDYRNLLSSYDAESGRLRSCSLVMVGPSHSSKPPIPAM